MVAASDHTCLTMFFFNQVSLYIISTISHHLLIILYWKPPDLQCSSLQLHWIKFINCQIKKFKEAVLFIFIISKKEKNPTKFRCGISVNMVKVLHCEVNVCRPPGQNSGFLEQLIQNIIQESNQKYEICSVCDVTDLKSTMKIIHLK